MTKVYNKIRFGLMAVLVPLVFSQILVACGDDYDEQLTMSKDVSVHLGVSADDVIDVSLSRSYAYDYYADEGEFIHSLCVFIVDSEGKIVKKFLADDEETSIFSTEQASAAANGNLTNWDSELDGLDEGTYTIYAFANWETTFGTITYDFGNYDFTKIWTPYTNEELAEDPWYILLNKKEEDFITEDEITFALSEVCVKIDFTQGRYIPMSGKNTVTITEGSNNVNVKLDRLVAKVYVTLQVIDTSNVYTGYELTCTPMCDIDWFATKVWLFPSDEVTPDDDYGCGVEIYLVDNPTVAVNGEAVCVGYTYINESDIDKTEYAQYGETYEVYIELADDDYYFWLVFEAWMKTRNIPRNTVLQLKVTYTDYFGHLVDAPAKKDVKTRGADTSESPVKWSIEETMY